MTLAIFLLSIFTVYIIISGIYILKKNILFGGVYFFLFIYSIFSQIGYFFLPELSELIYAYFGEKYFYSFYFFNFLSFLSFFSVFYFAYPYLKKMRKYELVRSKPSSRNYILFLVFVIVLLVFLFSFLLLKWNEITYENSYDDEFVYNQGLIYRIFAMGFKFMVPLNLMLYVQFRGKLLFPTISFFKRSWVFILLTASSLIFIIIANKNGSRTDIVAYFLGILVFELAMGINFKKVLRLMTVGVITTCFLVYLENTRTESTQTEVPLIQQVVYKDYYPPAHILYAAIAYNYVNPLEVVISNTANTFILIKHPYLQASVMDLFIKGTATRSSSYAFYFFTEGFIFMGFLGFIYNGLVLFFALSVWYLIQNTNNKFYNYLLLSVMCTQFANIARSQSSYFYKDIYMIFMPLMLLIYLSSGLRPKIKMGAFK